MGISKLFFLYPMHLKSIVPKISGCLKFLMTWKEALTASSLLFAPRQSREFSEMKIQFFFTKVCAISKFDRITSDFPD